MSTGDGGGHDAHLVSVTGGPAGIAASYAAARDLADLFDAAGDRLRTWATAGLRAAGDADLVESGLLSPGTCATAEVALLAAATGPQGALPASLSWEADAVAVRVAVGLLEEADRGAREALHLLDVALWDSPAAPVWLGVALATGQPWLTERLVDGAGGPVRGAAARDLSRLYADPGPARVRRLGVTVPAGRVRPTSVADLVGHLDQVAALSPDAGSPLDGTFEVQTLRDADGVRHVVYLPGTDRFDAPWDNDDGVRGMGTNLAMVGGLPDDYTAGVRDALHEAGVGPDEPVLVVGHSQGGMAAAALVAAPAGFAVVGAVTAGSPTAQVPGFPAGTHVLSLEQRGDVVPLLDGAPNPDSVEQTTVTFDADPGDGVLAHHSYETYEAGATLVDGSTDPSVAGTVQALHDAGFLGPTADGTTVTSQVFQVTR